MLRLARTFASALLLALVVATAAHADDHADQPAGATPLLVGAAPTAGRIDVRRDADWFVFPVRAGARYVVETSALADGMDTIIDAYGPTPTDHLGQDDDSAGNLASHLEVTASQDGSCWVVVRHYRASARRGTYALGVSGPPAPMPTPTPTVAAGPLDAAPVFDPRLEAASLAIGSRVPGPASYSARLRVLDAAGSVVRTLVDGATRAGDQPATDAWDGQDALLRFVAPGAYTLRLEASRAGAAPAVSERAVRVVRLGLVSVDFDATGRVPLTYHHPRAGVTGDRLALDALGPAFSIARSPLGDRALDLADGTPQPIPAIWTDVGAPPIAAGTPLLRGRSLPVAYPALARPRVRLRLGDLAGAGGAGVACGYPIPGGPIRLAVVGFAGAAGPTSGELAPGGEVTLDLPPVPATVGRVDLELEVRFEAWDGQAWRAVPGRHRTPHRVYVVHGAPPAGGRAWVATLDLALGWAAGSADRAATLAAIVQGVNARQGLRYDDVQGASNYTASSTSLTDPELDLEGYLARQTGSVVNCLDCASLVTALAAHVGVDAQVAVLGDNFGLNWIEGIGGTRFIHDLFGGWHAFSFHAVATVDAGATVHDACLKVDDDDHPDAAPFVERLPVGMPFTRYRQKLSPDVFRITGTGRATVR